MYGHIFDGRLRNLLLDIAEGRCGRLAEEHGRHALTVDLIGGYIGGYIGEFCGGETQLIVSAGNRLQNNELRPNIVRPKG